MAAEITPPGAIPDSWAALLQVGAQLVSALGAVEDARFASRPWIERDAVSGVPSPRLPLPPPQSVQRLADALSEVVDALRGRGAGR